MVTDNVHRLPVRLDAAIPAAVAEIRRNATITRLVHAAATDLDRPDMASVLDALEQAIRRIEAGITYGQHLASHNAPPIAAIGQRIADILNGATDQEAS